MGRILLPLTEEGEEVGPVGCDWPVRGVFFQSDPGISPWFLLIRVDYY